MIMLLVSQCFHMHILRPNSNHIFKDIRNNIFFICYYKVTATAQDLLLFMHFTSLKMDGNRIRSWQNVSKEEFLYQILHKSRNKALGPGSHMIQQMLFPAPASFHSEATASMFNNAPWITQDPVSLYK